MPYPWSRRSSMWDPLTPLDKFLLSPLAAIVQSIYAFLLVLRGSPFKPPQHKPPIRVVCISDTHTSTPNVPAGDLLVHAGDLTNAGNVQEIQAQIDWLDSLPHRYKIFIAGNHDSFFDPSSRKAEDKGKKLDFKGLHYLQNSSLHLKFKGGRSLDVWGSANIPKCGGSDFAFQYQRDLPPWEEKIPRATDILITHTPPRSHLDVDLGCAGLLQEIWRVKPRLHVFGHVHSGYGRESVFWDEGQLAYERLMLRKKGGIVADVVPSVAWVDALKVIWYGFKGIMWQYLMVGPKGANGGVLVNASMVWQSTTKLGHDAQVVEL